jgi:hypothetical protein
MMTQRAAVATCVRYPSIILTSYSHCFLLALLLPLAVTATIALPLLLSCPIVSNVFNEKLELGQAEILAQTTRTK